MSKYSDLNKSYYDNFSKETIKQQLDAIIDSSYDGIWICDKEARVLRVNKASERINNIKAEQVLQKRMQDIVNEGLIDSSVTLEVLKTKTAVTMIQKLKDGKQILVTGNPVLDENGEIVLVVTNDRDISELNKLRSELNRSRMLSKEYSNELSSLYGDKKALSDIIIRTESMHRVYKTAMKVAMVDSTVMIQGESGVGKGLFARLIHNSSKRRKGSFVRVDCSAIPESLIESELFGYEEGAFTGAKAKGKLGLFEIAKKGTLFLDEIGDIPLAVQIKLLRFIEDSELIPVGGTQPKRIDVRIIAATNRNLEKLIGQGTFRKDLFFRLNVVPIKIPPLRKRKEAIPYLVLHFLKRYNHEFSTEKKFLPRAVDCLCRYQFPGNIRELANLIEQMVVLSPYQKIREEDLPSHIRGEKEGSLPNPDYDGWDLRKAVQSFEKKWIRKALKTFGSQRKAAEPLGINQSTLHRKATKYSIRTDAILHNDA